MADIAYTRGLAEWGGFTTNTIRALLLKGAGYTPNKDHDYVADLTPGTNEVAGSGYARVTLASKTLTIDDTNDRVVFDADDPSFGSIAAGETVTGMVVYRFNTNDADSVLMAYYELASTPTNGSPFVVSLASTGLGRFQQISA